MRGPLLKEASQKRLQRLAGWTLPLVLGGLAAIAAVQRMHP